MRYNVDESTNCKLVFDGIDPLLRMSDSDSQILDDLRKFTEDCTKRLNEDREISYQLSFPEGWVIEDITESRNTLCGSVNVHGCVIQNDQGKEMAFFNYSKDDGAVICGGSMISLASNSNPVFNFGM